VYDGIWELKEFHRKESFDMLIVASKVDV